MRWMRLEYSRGILSILCLVALLAMCPRVGAESAPESIVMRMLGGELQAVPPTGSSAFAAGTFEIDTVANTVTYQITFSALAGGELSAGIYGPADVGMTGPLLHALPLGNPKSGVWTYDESVEADLLSSRTYVNLESNTFPAGEIRGQICDLVCSIDDDQTFPNFSTAAYGFGVFDIDTDTNMLTYHIEYVGLTNTEIASHIHAPASYEEVQMGMPPHILPGLPVKIGTWNYPEEFEDDLLDGRAYVNIHSSMFPAGETRGQIVSSLSPLDASQILTSVTTDATGYVMFAVDRVNGLLSYDLRFADLVDMEDFTVLHGPGLPGMSGPGLHTFPNGDRKLGSIPADTAMLDMYDACELYIDVHTTTFPDGEIRGQIVPGPQAEAPQFIRGDCNDDGMYNIADAISGLGVLFSMQGPEPCSDACDANDDGTFNIADMISILGDLFSMEPLPDPPHPNCGPDPTIEALDCQSYTSC